MKGLILALFIISLAIAKELTLNQVNVKVGAGYIQIDGKSYTLDKNVRVENAMGEPLNIQSLEYARVIKLEFDQKGNVRLIKILGWWD